MSGAGGMRVAVVITGDANGLKAEIREATGALDQLGRAGQQSGNQLGGGMQIASGAARALLPLLGAAGVAGALLAAGRAADAMTASMGRLQAATGSVEAAAQSYRDLYAISLQTGVAVAESANSFARFAIAARDIGASREQVTELVRAVQQAGVIAGSTTQETAAAAQQLGQALASGKLQGDELRSIMENMPTLVEALARELGVSIGELRKMGEEGKLTAERVFPALLAASQRINQQFEQLPITMARGFAQLGVATAQFVADLDRAVGASNAIARAAAAAASSLERVRQTNFGTPEQRATIAYDNAQSRVRELERTVESTEGRLAPRGPDSTEPNIVGAARQGLERALREQRERLAAARTDLDRITGERGAAALANDGSDAGGGASAGARASLNRGVQGVRTEFDGLRGVLDRPGQLRDEAEGRRATIRRRLAIDIEYSPEQAQRDLALVDKKLADEIKKLEEKSGGRGERSQRNPLEDRLSAIQGAIEDERRLAAATLEGGRAAALAEADTRASAEAHQLARDGSVSLAEALVGLRAGYRELADAQAAARASALEFQDTQSRSELALRGELIGATAQERGRRTAEFRRQQELDRAGIDPNSDRGRGLVEAAAAEAGQRLELERQEAAFDSIGRFGERAFDRIGESLTRMAAKGKMSFKDLGNIGNAIASELLQEFTKLALLNPLKNMLLGGNAPTLLDVGARLLPSVFGAAVGGFAGAGAPTAAMSIGNDFGSAVPDFSFMAPVRHGGGLIGEAGLASRLVPPSLFANARRFHGGGMIGPNEVPAILEKGEGVFTPEQMRALGPAGDVALGVRGGDVQLNVTFQGGDMGSERDRAAMAAQLRAVVRQEVAAAAPGIARGAHELTLSEARRGGRAARDLGRR